MYLCYFFYRNFIFCKKSVKIKLFFRSLDSEYVFLYIKNSVVTNAMVRKTFSDVIHPFCTSISNFENFVHPFLCLHLKFSKFYASNFMQPPIFSRIHELETPTFRCRHKKKTGKY